MRLTFEPSVLLGLALDDLEPLKNDCVGFSKAEEDGKYVYIIPLSDCGAEVKVRATISYTIPICYEKYDQNTAVSKLLVLVRHLQVTYICKA